ncbi:MAG: acyl-CoA dehydrogenase family protein [Thermodesulfobacteriota bacterium]
MYFELTEQEQSFCDSIRDKLQSMDVSTTASKGADIKEARADTLEVLQVLSSTGYLGMGIGDEKAKPDTVLLLAGMQVLAQYCPELYLAVEMSTRMFGRLIHDYGTDTQKQEILSALSRGEGVGSLALIEDCMNVQDNPMQTVGEPDGEDVRISGRKNFVINASIADWIAVVGKMGDQTAVFIVTPEDGPKIERSVNAAGCGCADVGSVTLDNVKVPGERVIGPFSNSQVLQDIRKWEDQVLIAYSNGIIKCSLEEAQSFAQEHKSGGKPIIAYQEIGFKLAEMITLLQTAELLAYKAAWSEMNKEKESMTLAQCAKTFCSETAETVSSKAMQILSWQGYAFASNVEAGFRNSKYCQIAGTSTEISRVRIGDAVLKGKQ